MPPFSSPFPTTSSKPGHGSVVLSLLPPGTPTFTTLSYTYPLKLLPSTPHTIPQPRASSSPTPPVSQAPKLTRTGDVEPADGDSGRTTREDNEHRHHASSAPHPPSPTSNAATAPSALLRGDATASSPAIPPATPPPPLPSQASLLFLLTYGGGLLAGDTITLSLTLNQGTRLVVATQGMGKIFPPPPPPPPPPSSPTTTITPTPPPPPPPPSAQHITATLAPHAALWLAPDPTQPFRSSSYRSTQSFAVARTGSVGVVEWVIQGRRARGECWDFGSWRSRIDVWECDRKAKRLLVRDNVVLENERQRGGAAIPLRERMDGMGVVGTVILLGPVFGALAGFFVEEFERLERIGGRDWGGAAEALDPAGQAEDSRAEEERRRERWRGDRRRMEKEQGVVWTACHVRGRKCCVVKFMAREMQGARDWLGGMLREEGTVGREFGEGGLMFVR